MTGQRVNRQEAPYPDALEELVQALRYKPVTSAWQETLEFELGDIDRGQGSKGLTLDIIRTGPDSYDPRQHLRVHHYFPVPPAAYNAGSWMRWLFERIGDVEAHERMENFALVDTSLAEPDDECVCGCVAPLHDGRDSSCAGCGATGHRFAYKTERLSRPYRPNHGHGEDPYVVHDPTTDEARRTSFRDVLDDDGTGRSKA